MNTKTTLLEKYSIPIEHLDFDYVKTCTNVRKLENIIEILKSGEEGYYPDLTHFTEEKLRELDPDNRMLRNEVKCFHTDMNERLQINEFVRIAKDADRVMRVEMSCDDDSDDIIPPVRSANRSVEVMSALKSIETTPKRINSFNYQQWDKYDADTECLKMDLNEERIRETALADQKRRQKQQSHRPLIEILSEEVTHDESNVERFAFANKHQVRGNEFFKCSDYQEAISEYTRSLSYAPTAAVFNNRAVAYLKQNKYMEAIQDCDRCLKIEAENVKAMLRKCDALIALDHKNQAYELYRNILKIDSNNATAKKALKNLSIRIEIQDVNVQLPHEIIAKQ